MHIERVRLENWLRYAGTNVVDLKPTIYGIFASFNGDARRSNWAGKTAFVESIRFALYGEHRKEREDDWITHGAPGGSVELHLSDGSIIRRSRRRGHSTQLHVERTGTVATGAAAQEAIDALVGLSRDDFEVTCWFGQKRLARLVLAKPTERFDLVSGWFGLEPLQRCEARTRAALAEVMQERERAERDRDGLNVSVDAMMRTLNATADPVARDKILAWLDDEYAIRFAALAALRSDQRRAIDDVSKLDGAKTAIDAKEELDRIRANGQALKAQIDALAQRRDVWAEAEREYDAARLALHDAAQSLRCAKQLKAQAFDGRCPVDHSSCPVAHEINGRVDANLRIYDDALTVYDRASKREALARIGRDDARAECAQHDALLVEIEKLRVRAKSLMPLAAKATVVKPDVFAAAHAQVERLQVAVAEAQAVVRSLESQSKEIRTILAKIETIETRLDALNRKERAARTALRVFGRQGAQRQIAEHALAAIEADANSVLSGAGIDLTIKIRWSHEGGGLAAWCGECGSAFPTSAKVRKCARCGAERGPKQIERLDVLLSDQSGAAEDLAGAALQLAAAAWLRRERGVAWSVGLLDEPFGSLDEANRKAFATQLMLMLRGRAGFEQAFIIAHHPDVLDGLPGSILVGARSDSSVLQAVS